MKKKLIIAIVSLVCVFLIADFFGLFGMLHKDGGQSVKFRFEVQDKNSGKPLTNVTVEAFVNSRQHPAKTEQTRDRHIISGYIMFPWSSYETILFTRHETPRPRGSKQIELIFTSPSYQQIRQTFRIKDLDDCRLVKLTPIETASPR